MNALHELPRFGQIDLNLFRVFAIIERERSLSRAAVVLSLSQSAVSHALARLRSHLGDPLFVRQGNRVAPTAFAATLTPFVRAALGDLERAVTRQTELDPRATITHVRVAMSEELEPTLAPALFDRLRAAVPEVVLTSAPFDRSAVRAELVGRRFDLAIDVARPTDDDLVHERILADELCVMANKKRRRLDRKGYVEAEHVAVSSRMSGPTLEDLRLADDGVKRRIRLRCQSYETACRVVATSDLLLTVPRRFAALRGLGDGLRVFPTPFRMARLSIHQYWSRSLDDDPASRWLREKVRGILTAAPDRSRR